MSELPSKDILVNELVGVRDTKIYLTYILTLKINITPSSRNSDKDMCLIKFEVIYATLSPIHFDLESILPLAKHFKLEQHVIRSPSSQKVFLKVIEEEISKILVTLA